MTTDVIEIEVADIVTVGEAGDIVTVGETGEVDIVTIGVQGPIGPAGASGADVVYSAGIALSGHRMVVSDASGLAQYADATTLAHATKVLGMTLAAAALGATVAIRAAGEIEEPSWAWDITRPIFLGANGMLTQLEPTAPSVFSLVVAFPITPTKAFIRVREPILI